MGPTQAAATALGKIGTPAVEPLVGALEDGSWEVRQAAALALAEIGTPAVGPLIDALKDEDTWVRWGAAKALGEIGDSRAVDSLIGALQDYSYQEDDRAAATALGKIGTPAVEPLIGVLGGVLEGARQAAATALGETGPPCRTPPVQ
ncbi:MAG: HEAT repeat domain-containing protein [Anaerolineales bacterium]|nr:HEAT repeat domain-containing protein [Anaerolineales bacterium]